MRPTVGERLGAIEFVENQERRSGWRVRTQVTGIHRSLCRIGVHAWSMRLEHWEAAPGEMEQGMFYRKCTVCGERR